MPIEKSYVDSTTKETISGLVYSPDEVAEMDEAQVNAAAEESFYVSDASINSKADSIEKGLNRYWNGKPCKNGHISDRYNKGTCIQCFRNAVKARRSTEHGKEVYQAARKRAMDRKRAKKTEGSSAEA